MANDLMFSRSKPKAQMGAPEQNYELRPLGGGICSFFVPDGSTNESDDFSTLVADGRVSGVASASVFLSSVYDRGDVIALKIGDSFGSLNRGVTISYSAISAACVSFSCDLKAPLGMKFNISAYDGSDLIATRLVIGTGFWQRDDIWVTATDFSSLTISIELVNVQDQGTWQLARPQLEKKSYPTSWIGNDVIRWYPGNSGIEQNALGQWTRPVWSNAGGKMVRLNTLGARTTGYRGTGLSARQHVTSPYTLRNGTVHQRGRWRHREFGILAQLTTPSLKDILLQRGEIERMMVPLRNYDENPFCVHFRYLSEDGVAYGRELELWYRYVSGMEGRLVSDFGEILELSLICDDSFFHDPTESFAEFTLGSSTSQSFTITNYGDAPAPLVVEVRGTGNLTSVVNSTNLQSIEFSTAVPLDSVNYFRMIPEDAYVIHKASYWTPDFVHVSSKLSSLKLGGHLPIFEVIPTRCHRVGDNEIQLNFDSTTAVSGSVRFRWQQRWLSLSGMLTDWDKDCVDCFGGM